MSPLRKDETSCKSSAFWKLSIVSNIAARVSKGGDDSFKSGNKDSWVVANA